MQLSTRIKVAIVFCAACAMVVASSVHLRAVPADEVLLAQAGEEAAQPESGQTVTVRGKVLGPDGQPLAEAQVLVQYNGPDWKTRIQKAMTKADGGFSFSCEVVNLTRRMCVAAHKPGLAVDWAPLLPRDQDITLRLAADPVAFAGTVKDPEGNPIAGAEVHINCLVRPAGEKPAKTRFSDDPHADEFLRTYFFPEDEEFLHATSDEAGRFEIPDLPAEAKVRLTVLAEGRERLDMQDETIPAGTRDFEVVLAPEAVISGRIIHDGRGVGGREVLCTTDSMLKAKTVSAEDGTYKLDKLRSGTYDVRIDAPEGLITAPVGPITLAPGEVATDMNLVLTRGALVNGTVTDGETGQPLAGARISAALPTTYCRAESDADGNYVLHVPPGRYEVLCYDPHGLVYPKLQPRRRTVKVADGETIAGMDFVAWPRRQRTLRGEVLGPDGEPAANVEIVGPMKGFLPEGSAEFYSTRTDAQGDFKLMLTDPSGPERPSVVWARDVAKSLAAAAIIEDPERPLTLRLADAGHLTCQAMDTEGEPVPDVCVRVFADHGHSLLDLVWMRSDQHGKMSSGPLPPGISLRFMLTGKQADFVLDDDWCVPRQAVNLAPGEERELPPLRFNLQGRSVKGWVGNQRQQPVKGALVFAPPIQDPFVVGESGDFELTGLPARGTVWIVAVHPTEPLFAAENTDPDWGFEPGLILKPMGKATGKILNKQGQPVEGARVSLHPPSHWSGMASLKLLRRLGKNSFYWETMTDQQGKWSLEGLIGGMDYEVFVYAPGGDGGIRHADLTARGGETVDLARIELQQ